jgi:hypothetical protein
MPAPSEPGKFSQRVLLWAVLIIVAVNLAVLLRVLRPGREVSNRGSLAGPTTDSVPSGAEFPAAANAKPIAAAKSANLASTNPTVIGRGPSVGPVLGSLEPRAGLNDPLAPKPGAPLSGSDSSIHVRGKVVLVGTPPAEKEITPLRNDPNCGRLHPEPVFTRHYVVAADGGLANVFVYVTNAVGELPAFTMPSKVPLLDQVGCLYQPYVIGVMTGQPLMIRNTDGFMHNINYSASTTGSPANRPFNIAQAGQGQVDTVTFKNPELFGKLACNVHPWMFAYIGVVEHPWFAVTDEKGEFDLPPGLPAGVTLHVRVVHLKAGPTSQTLIGPPGSTNELRFELSPP